MVKEPLQRRAISVKEAQKRILQHCPQSKIEVIELKQACGRRIAEHVCADAPMPAFSRSGMDGYAVHAASTDYASASNPIILKVKGRTIACGDVPTERIESGEAQRIMTGAMLPEGADAVIQLEAIRELEAGEESQIEVRRKVAQGLNVSLPGSEIAHGEQLISQGSKIGTGQMTLLAAYGFHTVKVYRKPKVAILATGSELLRVDEELQPGKVRNSNVPMLWAQIESVGAEPIDCGQVADDQEELIKRLHTAASCADVVITSGGVSVGDYDQMAKLLRSSEGLLFNKVQMRPGSATSAAIVANKPLIALSGNPGACFVGFELFVKPLLLQMQGVSRSQLMSCRLDGDLLKVNAYERFVRASIRVEEGVVFAKPLAKNKSSMMVSLQHTDCFIIVPPQQTFRRGDLVQVLLIIRRW